MTSAHIPPYPTHLAISGDLIISHTETISKYHTIDAILYDEYSRPYLIDLGTSSPPPRGGCYLGQNMHCSTHPLHVHVPDANKKCLRAIPDGFDGADPELPSLCSANPILSGVGVIMESDPDRQCAILAGLTDMGQVNGSKPFFVKGYTSAPLMSYMKALASRALVDFGGVMDGMSNDGTITAKIFRINQVGEANGKLVQELKNAESAKNSFVKQSHGRINADYTDYTDGPEYDSYVDGPFAPTGEEITYDPEYEYESEPSTFN